MTSRALSCKEFLQDLDGAVDRAISDHHVLHVQRGEGRDFVVLSAEDWESIEETMYLKSIPGYVDSLKQALAEPVEEGIPLEELEW